jgi:hypothetical protein
MFQAIVFNSGEKLEKKNSPIHIFFIVKELFESWILAEKLI